MRAAGYPVRRIVCWAVMETDTQVLMLAGILDCGTSRAWIREPSPRRPRSLMGVTFAKLRGRNGIAGARRYIHIWRGYSLACTA